MAASMATLRLAFDGAVVHFVHGRSGVHVVPIAMAAAALIALSTCAVLVSGRSMKTELGTVPTTWLMAGCVV